MKKLFSMETCGGFVCTDWNRVDSMELTPGQNNEGNSALRLALNTSDGKRHESKAFMPVEDARSIYQALDAFVNTACTKGQVASLEDFIASRKNSSPAVF